MYREQASRSALSGVVAGPYGGGAKELDTSRLSSTTAAKLAASLNATGSPRPVTAEHPRDLMVTPGFFWGLILPFVIGVVAFVHGFGDDDGVRQPPWMFAVYALCGVLVVMWIFATLRRRTEGELLRPGTYLFPLDVVVVTRLDKTGRQRVTVKPLGGAREGQVHTAKRTELVLRFQDSSETRIAWPGDAESAHRHLELTQRILDELTLKPSLDVAFRNDLFFDFRADNSWATAAPIAEAPRGNYSRLTSLVLGRGAPLYALLLGALVAVPIFALRHRMGEQLFFERAVARGTPAAMDEYLAQGGSYVNEAKAEKKLLLDHIEHDRLEREAEEARERASANLGATPISTRECELALEKASAENHPEVLTMMKTVLEGAGGRTRVDLVFRRRHLDTPPAGEPHDLGLAERLDNVEVTFVKAFSRVFAETCPLITWRRGTSYRPNEMNVGDALDIAYDLTWTPKSYGPAISIVFDVTVHVPGDPLDGRPKTTFRLTMDPPTERLATTRTMSLFTISEPDHVVFDAMVARAFDRLYDEVFGLFFRGSPRVPLK